MNKDKDLPKILDEFSSKAVALAITNRTELYVPTVKEYEKKIRAWRDKAVKEARVEELKKVKKEYKKHNSIMPTDLIVENRIKELEDKS